MCDSCVYVCVCGGGGGQCRDPQVEKRCWDASQVGRRQSEDTATILPALQSVEKNQHEPNGL